MTLELTTDEKLHLTILLNYELRQITGEASHPLNSIFRKLCGRDHDVYAIHHPTHCKPNIP